MSYTYELVVDCKNELGESPIWSTSEQALYWVDITEKKIFRWHSEEGLNFWQTSQMTSCLMLHESGDIIVCQENEINQVKLLGDGQMKKHCLHTLTHPHAEMRLNDGVCDRSGDIWISSMSKANTGEAIGSLYRFSKDGLSKHLDSFCTPNGLAFSPDGKTMYMSDSHPSVQKIWAFDYDVDEGVLSNRRLFIDMKDYPGRPDGATVDAEGCYWICATDSGLVLRFSPEAKLIAQYELPVANPTKCTFGGSRLDTLFVTSLRPNHGDLAKQALAGGVFALYPRVQGLNETLGRF